MRTPMLWLFATAAGCTFKVAGVGTPGSHLDLSPGAGWGDLAGMPGGGLDLSPTGPGLTLSHLPGHWLTDGNCDLSPVASISTSSPLQIDGAAVPNGCVFAVDQEGTLEVAVLAVKNLAVEGTVKVTGARPLVIVAAGKIEIKGTLDGSADKTSPGPGGGVAGQGASGGKDGSHAGQYDDSGGGGGGGLTAGSSGATATFNSATPAVGGAAGLPFAGDYSIALPGGAGGGKMSAEACNAVIANGGAGAGGGSIQLSARNEIRIGGEIDVGGGGGLGGCVNGQPDQGSGGGGGAGGVIWIEAPMVSASGGLWANGGSGGSGAEGLIGASGTTGSDGTDGSLSMTPAAGGTSPGMYAGAGGSGGTGTGLSATSGSAPGVPTLAPAGMTANGGGGGGSAGMIKLRYKALATLSSNVSPAPQLDSSVP